MESTKTPDAKQEATKSSPAAEATATSREASKKNKVLLPAIIAGAFVLIGGGLALSSLGSVEDPETVYNKFIEKSQTITTFTQNYDLSSEGTGITLVSNTDLSDPASPKSTGDVKFVIEGTEGLGDLSIDAEYVAIDEDVYVNYESFEAPDLSQEDSDLFAEAFGDDYELADVFGIENPGEWQLIDLTGAADFDSVPENNPNDPFSISLLAATVNTSLGAVPSGNFGDNAAKVAEQFLGSESLAVSFDGIEIQDLDGTDTYTYVATVNPENVFTLNRALAEEYGLNTLPVEIDENSSEGEYEAKITVDANEYLPVKVELDEVEITYSNFGDSFTIEKPL